MKCYEASPLYGMNNPVIEIRNLSKNYNGFEAVRGLDFTVNKGDVFGFLGPNGAGKSTTIRMMTTLIKPSGGEIRFFGKNLYEHPEKVLGRIGAIVEKPDLYNFLSAYDNLKMLSRISGKPASDEKINETLTLVGLQERAKSKVKTFSQGMKQRLGIAQALIHDPELIILDEPANGLDPQGMVEIRNLILKLSREYNKTILLSSHILNEVELIANRMVIINKGKSVIEGDVRELLDTGDMKVTVEITHPDKAKTVINNSSFQNHLSSVENGKLIFRMPKEEVPALNRYLIEHGIEVKSLVPVRSLEDLFLSLT